MKLSWGYGICKWPLASPDQWFWSGLWVANRFPLLLNGPLIIKTLSGNPAETNPAFKTLFRIRGGGGQASKKPCVCVCVCVSVALSEPCCAARVELSPLCLSVSLSLSIFLFLSFSLHHTYLS